MASVPEASSGSIGDTGLRNHPYAMDCTGVVYSRLLCDLQCVFHIRTAGNIDGVVCNHQTKETKEGFMAVTIRQWKREDAADLAESLSNPKVQDNLRDGLPYPYTEKDAVE